MNDVLLVIDMQKDFVDGALGTAEAQHILPAVVKKVQNFKGTVIFTKDTHPENYLETQEGRLLPFPHCIKGTPGWELVPKLKDLQTANHYAVYEKPTFGCVTLATKLLAQYEQGRLDSVELVGLCTDICVVSNGILLKAYMPDLPISVDASCCAGVTPQKHRAALEVMKSCQILVKNE